MRILKFPKNFSENTPDLNLQKKLNQELPGILNWALEGYKIYKAKGLEPTPNMSDALENYKKYIDPLDGFFEDKIEVTNKKQDFISTNVLVDKAKFYAFQEDRGKIEKTHLLKYMKMKGYQRIMRRTENGRIRGFSGLRIVEFKDYDVPF